MTAKNCFIMLILCFSTATGFSQKLSKHIYYLNGFNQKHLDLSPPVPPRPIFWDSSTKVSSGIGAGYEHLVLNYKDMFSFYPGGFFFLLNHNQTIKKEQIYAFGISFSFKGSYFVSDNISFYGVYGAAGPSFLTKKHLGKALFSEKFVFMDQIGLGVTVKSIVDFDLSFRMVHFSNGDIFPVNTGINIPFVVQLGIRVMATASPLTKT